jgi:hypothetical protein
MVYYEQPDNLKSAPIISIPLVLVVMLHAFLSWFVYYATKMDLTGYPSSILSPLIYFGAFLVLLTILVEIKNKSAGLLDMIVGFITLVATYVIFA